MRAFWILALLALFPAAGCTEPQKTAAKPGADTARAPASTPAAPTATAAPQGKPQPKLATIKLWMGIKEMVAEQCLTFGQITNGMMFRTEMGENEGMLFVFGGPHQASFWMRNTLIPMSCAYIDPKGVILEIRDMKPLDETPILAKTDQVQYVLETPQGWFEKNQIGAGTLVKTEKGTLSETYFGRRLE